MERAGRGSLRPLATPTSVDYFPFGKGKSHTYRWTNTKNLAKPEVETIKADAVVNNKIGRAHV